MFIATIKKYIELKQELLKFASSIPEYSYMIRVNCYFLITFIAVSFNSVSAQEIEWQKSIGGSEMEIMKAVINTADGGYLLGGHSWSNISGDKTANCHGSSDYWLVKIDSAGIIQWDKTIGGTGSDQLATVIQTSDGGFLVGGVSNSNISGDKTENSQGYDDFWIVKITSNGSIQWQNTIGGSDSDELYSIIQTSDGGFLLGGNSKSNISGDKTENSLGIGDYWIVKTDSIGTIQWQNTIGGSGGETIEALVQSADGGFLLGGQSTSDISGDKTEDSHGYIDYWIVKTDSNGNIQWQNTIGGNHIDHLTDIIQTNDGGYVLGGYSGSPISGDKTEPSQGMYDLWIVKTDSSGNILWQKTIGGDRSDYLYSIKQTTDGGFLIGAVSQSGISGDKSEIAIGASDFWVIKTDSACKILFQNTIGGDYIEPFCSGIQTPDGNYLIAGYSYSNISGDKTENLIGVADYWILKLRNSYNLIQGELYADLNSNLINESSEPGLKYHLVNEANTGRIAFSNSTGKYSLTVLDTGSYSIFPAFRNHFISAPVTHSAQFNSLMQIDSLKNFAFQPVGSINNLCITITPTGPFRSGFNSSYMISYSNTGTTNQVATIVFYPDTAITFISANIPPTSITGDSIIFSPGLLSPFQSGQILITVNVHTGVQIGTLINSGASILPIIGDAEPSCNLSYREVFTTGSYDPNDILVNRENLYTYELPSPPYLEYIIRFQNTGNDTAFFVNILNPIDTTRLELFTFEYIASSHPLELKFINHEKNMQFYFPDILLPDSNTNESMSHGFIHYRIKPKSNLSPGDTISNFAAIYFDFNNPVITNTATTEIILPSALTTHASKHFRVFPNPANNLITIHAAHNFVTDTQIHLYNIYGQLIQTLYDGEIADPEWHKTVDISSLSRGLYFIKVSGGVNSTVRFVKY